jgi:catechol 2,3-dioxygenase-like lactoylglutathione lyase family enzyme
MGTASGTPRPSETGESKLGGAVESASPRPPGSPHLALSVSNASDSAVWWCRTFGFRPGAPPDHARSPARVTEVIRHPDTGLVLSFRQHAEASGRGRFEYVSLRVTTEQALGEWAAHLDRLAIPHSSVWGNGTARYLSFTAPDGVGLELWCTRPS